MVLNFLWVLISAVFLMSCKKNSCKNYLYSIVKMSVHISIILTCALKNMFNFVPLKQKSLFDFLMFLMKYLRWPTGAKHNSIPLSEHKIVFQNARIFFRTQESFSEHNNLF